MNRIINVYELVKETGEIAMTNSKNDKEVELAEKEKKVLERISNEISQSQVLIYEYFN
jgi:hypothetical protein